MEINSVGIMGSEVVVAPMFFMVTTFNPRRLNFCLIASGLLSINWAIRLRSSHSLEAL